jgi:hypothetical protein
VHGNPNLGRDIGAPLGNKGGRPKGRLNDATYEIRQFCQGIIRSDEYRTSVMRRIKNDTLPPQTEALLLAYGYGKPPEHLHLTASLQDARNDLSELTEEQLAERAELLAMVLRAKAEAEAAAARVAEAKQPPVLTLHEIPAPSAHSSDGTTTDGCEAEPNVLHPEIKRFG